MLHLGNRTQLANAGAALLNYRVDMSLSIPTRLKSLYSWNMNSWSHPKSSREDPKMRRIKKLLQRGPVLLQETKWADKQEEVLLQHISGLQVVSTSTLRTSNDHYSGVPLTISWWTVGMASLFRLHFDVRPCRTSRTRHLPLCKPCMLPTSLFMDFSINGLWSTSGSKMRLSSSSFTGSLMLARVQFLFLECCVRLC